APVVAPTDNKPNYPSHLTPYAIKMLEEQRKRNEMFQGIGDTATGIYEGAKTLGSDIYDDVTGFDYKGLGSDIYKEGSDAIQGAQDLYQDFTKPDTRTKLEKWKDNEASIGGFKDSVTSLFNFDEDTKQTVDANYYKDVFTEGPTLSDKFTKGVHLLGEGIEYSLDELADSPIGQLGQNAFVPPSVYPNSYNTKDDGSVDYVIPDTGMTEGILQGVFTEVPQEISRFVAHGINYGANKLGEEDIVNAEEWAKTIPNIFPKEDYPELWEEGTFNFGRVGSQWVTGYGLVKKLMTNVLKTSFKKKFAKEVIASGGGAAMIDLSDGDISTFVNSTEYKNALSEYLDSQIDNPNAEEFFTNKLKAIAEDMGITIALPLAFLGTLRMIKGTPDALRATKSFATDMVDPKTWGGPIDKVVDKLLPGMKKEMFMGGSSKYPPKETRITLNEQKAEAKTKANLERQAIEDAKPKAEVDELGFYSKAEQALLDLKQEKNLPQDIITYLKKKGVTQGELEDTGLLEMLTKKKASGDRVTKQGLLDYIGENKVKLQEYQKYGASEGDALDNMGDFELDDPDFYNGADGGNMSVVDDTDYIYSRAEDMKYELNSGDEYQMNRLFEYLHKSDPEKYPKTIDMQIEEIELSLKRLTDADREVLKKPVADITLEERRKLLDFYKDNLGNPHEQAIMLPTEDIGIYGADGLRSKNMDDIVTEINTFFGDSNTKLIDLQNQRSTTNGYTDDWAGQIGKKIDDGNIDNLDFNIDDATYAMSEADYL
ncbi:MAG: hypothetical protein ABGY11_05305, partial [Candidatus Thioglobus sp.]